MELALPYICTAAAALVTTLLLTPVAKRLAFKVDAVDYPSQRRINTRPTPRLGGLAVFCGIAVAVGVRILGSSLFGWPSVLVPHPRYGTINYPLLAASFAVMVAIGAIDDIFQLPPKVKLAGQLVAAVMAAASGLVINSLLDPFDSGAVLKLGWVAYPITIVYLVAFANIINLIDGLDGLAAGISCIAAASMCSFAILAGHADAAALSIAVVGACLGFLRYNFHPASIFLGDSGSLTLGFALGVISLLNVSRTAAVTTLIIPLIVAGVPILDTFSAIIRRMRAHVNIGQADKGHIHHRLIQEGYDQRQAVLLIYAWTLFLSVGAMIINQVSAGMRVIIFLVLLAVSVAFALHLHLFEPVLRHYYNPKTKKDELVTPEDPAFEEAARADQEEHAESLAALGLHPIEELLDAMGPAEADAGPDAGTEDGPDEGPRASGDSPD